MTILQSLLCYVIGWSINFTLLGTIKGFKDSRKTALISLAWPVVLPAMGIVIGYKVWFQHQTELESKTELLKLMQLQREQLDRLQSDFSGMLVYAHEKTARGFCPRCGTVLTDGTCTECGADKNSMLKYILKIHRASPEDIPTVDEGDLDPEFQEVLEALRSMDVSKPPSIDLKKAASDIEAALTRG